MCTSRQNLSQVPPLYTHEHPPTHIHTHTRASSSVITISGYDTVIVRHPMGEKKAATNATMNEQHHPDLSWRVKGWKGLLCVCMVAILISCTVCYPTAGFKQGIVGPRRGQTYSGEAKNSLRHVRLQQLPTQVEPSSLIGITPVGVY